MTATRICCGCPGKILGIFPHPISSAAKNKAGDNKVAYAQLVNFYRSRIAVAVQRGNLIAINRWLYRRRTAAQGSAGGGSG